MSQIIKAVWLLGINEQSSIQLYLRPGEHGRHGAGEHSGDPVEEGDSQAVPVPLYPGGVQYTVPRGSLKDVQCTLYRGIQLQGTLYSRVTQQDPKKSESQKIKERTSPKADVHPR